MDRTLKAKLFRGQADAPRLTVLEALRGGPRCARYELRPRAGNLARRSRGRPDRRRP